MPFTKESRRYGSQNDIATGYRISSSRQILRDGSFVTHIERECLE